MMHSKRARLYLGRARPVTGLAFLVLCTMLVVTFVAMVDDQASALWSPLSPLESPLSPTPDTSPVEESLTPTAIPPEAAQAEPAPTELAPTEEAQAEVVQAEAAQAEAAQAAPASTGTKQSPAWRSLFGIGLIALGLALVIGGLFWLVRRA